MKVYFVRHGESTLGEQKHQLPDSPLSEVGIKQAADIAQRFTNIPIDLILASSYTRALQTARAIEKIKGVPLIKSDLLIERKMPSLFHGKPAHDPEIVPIHQEIREHFYDPSYHYADEENFADLISRTKGAIDLVQSQQKEEIAVVTHGYFLTVMIFHILFGDNVDPQAFQLFRNHTENSNTGLTVCEVKGGNWKLLTWNDIAHLGE
jgi:2,3-bisphosphoglycerate-dependent phosphoglycerate mutase